MDMLSGNVRSLYFKYLTAAFGSALISSIYGIVDTERKAIRNRLNLWQGRLQKIESREGLINLFICKVFFVAQKL